MPMGPITLFDKSFIQSLSLDESVWFDHFYYSVICPFFYVETLADLSKKMPEGRSAEKEVSKIADKFPEMTGNPCMHHIEMCLANLLGNPISMDGRIIMRGGVPVKSGERQGIVYRDFPETQALDRWHRGDFLEVEEKYAKAWRLAISSLDLEQTTSLINKFQADPKKCKSLEEAYRLAHGIVSSNKPYDQMALAVLFLQIPDEHIRTILKTWQLRGLPPIETFAPYASFVIKIELFFQIAVAAGLISAARPSNRIDIAYLFYLPFCMAFVSSDKLHRRCAPHFLRADQEFVWGLDLKEDLKKLNERYSRLPEEIKEKGVMCFASTPPQDEEFLTSSLWDRHTNPNWRERDEIQTELPASNKKLVKELKSFSNAKQLDPNEVDFDLENVEAMSVQRMIRKKKGNWFQISKDMKEDES